MGEFFKKFTGLELLKQIKMTEITNPYKVDSDTLVVERSSSCRSEIDGAKCTTAKKLTFDEIGPGS